MFPLALSGHHERWQYIEYCRVSVIAGGRLELFGDIYCLVMMTDSVIDDVSDRPWDTPTPGYFGQLAMPSIQILSPSVHLPEHPTRSSI
jgi:hypothetical protein